MLTPKDVHTANCAAVVVQAMADETLEVFVANLDNATVETLHYILLADADRRDMILLEKR